MYIYICIYIYVYERAHILGAIVIIGGLGVFSIRGKGFVARIFCPTRRQAGRSGSILKRGPDFVAKLHRGPKDKIDVRISHSGSQAQ